jgi:hypothetical protein
MKYDLSKVQALSGMAMQAADDSAAEAAKVRQQLLECLTRLGIDTSGAPPAPDAGPGVTALIWADDHGYDVMFYAVPDAAISEAQRAALAATPFCFANEMDCDDAGWFGALRVMAAIGAGDGTDGAELYQIGVEDADLTGGDGAPTQDELVSTWQAWAPHHVMKLATSGELGWLAARFTAVHAFNKAM